jgi:hypothetical protein
MEPITGRYWSICAHMAARATLLCYSLLTLRRRRATFTIYHRNLNSTRLQATCFRQLRARMHTHEGTTHNRGSASIEQVVMTVFQIPGDDPRDSASRQHIAKKMSKILMTDICSMRLFLFSTDEYKVCVSPQNL